LLLPGLILSANTDMIEINKNGLDSLVKDIMWCGNSNDVVLVLSENGTPYKSRDKGHTWKRL